MLCIKTKLKESEIAGIGLFAHEPIKKGEVVWKFEPTIDILLTRDQIDALSEASRSQFRNYAFFDETHKKFMLCGDDGRFFNHSDEPNCDDSQPDITVALRDIEEGEELTVNYKEFYGDIDEHPEIR